MSVTGGITIRELRPITGKALFLYVLIRKEGKYLCMKKYRLI